MAEITAGLRKLSQRDLLPDGSYEFEIDRVQLTKKGDGEGAILKVIGAPDEELVGRTTYIYLLNLQTEQSIGLSMVLRSLKLTNVPDGEYGDSETRNLEGHRFHAEVTTKPDKNGVDRNNVIPSYDADWWQEVLDSPEEDEEKPKARKKTSRKKKVSKKQA